MSVNASIKKTAIAKPTLIRGLLFSSLADKLEAESVAATCPNAKYKLATHALLAELVSQAIEQPDFANLALN